jgi:hypothetical protein
MRTVISIPLFVLCLCGCSAPPVEYSQLQFREMETRMLIGTRDQVMESVLAVLQDGGYFKLSADHRLGAIAARSGLRDCSRHERTEVFVTVKVDECGADRTRVRTSFTSHGSVHKKSLFGASRWEYSSRRVSNPQQLLAFYAEVDRELLKRRALAGQAGAPAPTPDPPSDRHGEEERPRAP